MSKHFSPYLTLIVSIHTASCTNKQQTSIINIQFIYILYYILITGDMSTLRSSSSSSTSSSFYSLPLSLLTYWRLIGVHLIVSFFPLINPFSLFLKIVLLIYIDQCYCKMGKHYLSIYCRFHSTYLNDSFFLFVCLFIAIVYKELLHDPSFHV